MLRGTTISAPRNFAAASTVSIPDSIKIIGAEAFAGKITSTLDAEKHTALEKTMRLGKEFYADFKAFVYLTDAEEDEFVSLFQNTAVIVQRLGQMYSKRCFDD